MKKELIALGAALALVGTLTACSRHAGGPE